ncbi:MAG TPA: hypothetical protein VFH82_08000 [Gemmatimonadota bacterium]|jgi:hypothetical protein|nr:hypothetical protein [Gemmatimonadota bacterium]
MRIHSGLLGLGMSVVAACAEDSTTGPDGIVVFETSFESGFDDFVADGTDLDDPPIEWSIERTQEAADDGAWSVRLDLDNLNDAGKIWIERAFDLEPGVTYDVEVTYAFGTSDFGDVNTWTIIAGVDPENPELAGDLTFQGDTSTGEDEESGVVWLDKTHSFTATAGAGGELWVSLGVWGTSEFPRTYYIDDVRIEFTPR